MDKKDKQETLRYIYSQLEYGYIDLGSHDENELEIIKEALKKQTPMRPYYEADGYADGVLAYDYAKCPVCGHDFECGVNDWGCAYCQDCGQALDWTEDEDEENMET